MRQGGRHVLTVQPSRYKISSPEFRRQFYYYLQLFLLKSEQQLGFRVPATRMRRLWTMLAHLQGEPVNYSKLGANLEIDGKTVSHYIDILSDLLLVKRLEPWHANSQRY